MNGIHATSLALLEQGLRHEEAPADILASDLSLGAWRGQQVASEFCAQLSLPPPLPQPIPFSMNKMVALDEPLPYADVIGAWIDAESSGDRIILGAMELASRVAAAVLTGPPRTLLIITPRFATSWEIENIYFLRFLAQGLHGSDSRVLVVNTDPSPPLLPDDWRVSWTVPALDEPSKNTKSLLDLVPGVLLPEVATVMQTAGSANGVPLLPLPRGHALIAPERRRGPRTASRFEYDKLAVLTHSFAWIKGYAQFFGNNLYVAPFFLCREAWRRFAEGGYGVALRFMERAVACSPVLEQEGFLRAQAQGIRIGLQRFAEAAAEPEPSPALAPAVRGFLLQNKGWGLVMSNEPARAETYFREARARFEQALRVRLGDAVAKIERHATQDCVVFKRYLSPIAIAGKDRRLLSLLEDHPAIGELWRRMGQQGAVEDFLATVRALEQSRVVVLSLANEVDIGTSAELCVEESHAR